MILTWKEQRALACVSGDHGKCVAPEAGLSCREKAAGILADATRRLRDEVKRLDGIMTAEGQDPNGTIWEHAAKQKKEIDELNRRVLDEKIVSSHAYDRADEQRKRAEELVRAVADHVTVRAEQREKIQMLEMQYAAALSDSIERGKKVAALEARLREHELTAIGCDCPKEACAAVTSKAHLAMVDRRQALHAAELLVKEVERVLPALVDAEENNGLPVGVATLNGLRTAMRNAGWNR